MASLATLVIAGHEAKLHRRVTSVYRNVDGDWKLTHHYTDLSEAMMDILRRLNAAAF